MCGSSAFFGYGRGGSSKAMATIPGYVQEDRGETPFPDRGSRRADRLSPVAALARGRGKQRRLEPVAVVAPHQRRNRRQTIRPAGTSIRKRRFSTVLLHITWDGRHGFRTAAPAVPEKRARAAHLRAHDGLPSRQASPSLCHEPQQPRQGLPERESIARGAN